MNRVDTTASFSPVLTSSPPERSGVRRAWRRWWAACLLALWIGPLLAQPPQVRQLSLQRSPDALYLSARLDLTPTSVVQDALIKGVPLYFVWQAGVYRQRWYWTDKRVAGAVRILRLAYQPLTRRWRVSLSTDAGATGGGAGLQYALHQNHDSLADALSSIGRVARWRVADGAVLEPGENHRVEFSFGLDLSLLPRPFQIGVANQPEWTVEIAQRLRVPDTVVPEPAPEPRDTGVPAAEAAGASAREDDDPPSR